MKKFVLGSVFAIWCITTHAEDSKWRFYAGIGLAHGGDTISSGTIVDTSSNLTIPFNIKAGTATEFRVGADYRLSKLFTVQASAGHADEAPSGINGSIDFKTTPVELLGFFNIGDAFRIGGGVRKTHGDMSGTGIAANWPGMGSYTGSTGTVVEAQYLFATDGNYSSPHNLFGLSLRLVNENFTHEGVSFGGHHYEIGGAYYY